MTYGAGGPDAEVS